MGAYEGRHALIFAAAPETDYSYIRAFLGEHPDALIACADGGLRHARALGLHPDFMISDCDSMPETEGDEVIRLKPEKDDTDTMLALREGLRRGCDTFYLYGATGGARLDHTLGNVSILLYLDSLGKKAEIVDDYSEMQIVSKDEVSIEDKYPFFSLLNITGCARGITIRDAKYPLDGAEITCEYQYGVSNEVLPGKTAKISVRDGKLLLIKICRQ